MATTTQGFISVRTITPIEPSATVSKDFASMLKELRASFESHATYSLAFRRAQLRALRHMVVQNKQALFDAIRADLGQHPTETIVGEFMPILSSIDSALRGLRRWMRDQRAQVTLVHQPGSAYVRKQPKGVCLIIAPWNYPVQLALCPLVGAIAAGCGAVLKPSEVSSASEEFLFSLIPKYLDQRFYRVVKGAAPETTALLALKWDHIFYTGNGAVGRIVAHAAAEHLTTITLELGGKSPVYVHSDCSLKVTVHRIIKFKTLNCGQVCTAPDYVLVHADIKDAFVSECVAVIRAFYGEDPKASTSYGRIINERHFDRVAKLLEDHGGQVVIGGMDSADRSNKYVPPTVVVEPSPTSRLMSEEIFGPVLAVISVKSLQEAVAFINSRDHPLGAYVFTQSSAIAKTFINDTTSGGACINQCVEQFGIESLPFGGTGESGCGKYHGRYGFEEFSHSRAIFKTGTMIDLSFARYPPYKKLELRLLKGWLGL